MSDYYDTIQSRIDDEKRDVITYEALAAKAPNDGAAQLLRDIAHEESLHAEHLEYILAHKDEAAAVTDTHSDTMI